MILIVLTLEIAIDLETSIAKPLRNQEAPRQHPLKQTTELPTVLGCRNFGAIHGDDSREEADGDTSGKSARDHHGDVLGATLKGTAENRNASTDEHGLSASEFVGQPSHRESSWDGTSREGRNYPASLGCSWCAHVSLEVGLNDRG